MGFEYDGHNPKKRGNFTNSAWPNDFMPHVTITTANDVYAFVEQLKAEAEKRGNTNLATKLDDALHLGSSGLEILGAIRKTLIENHGEVESLLDSDECEKPEQIIAFVNKAFGR